MVETHDQKAVKVSYKPGLLVPAKTWQVLGHQLTTPKNQTFDLKSITRAHFINMPVKRRWTTELKLTGPDDSVTIVCNDTVKSQNRYQYFILISAILNRLQACNPDLGIRYGYGQTTNYIFACIGLIPIGFGLSFLIQAIGDNFDRFPLIMGLGFILFGIFFVWCISPWKASATYAPAQLRSLLYEHPSIPL